MTLADLVAMHYTVHRDIGWLVLDGGRLVEDGDEIPVCGFCVPPHTYFRRREDVPVGPCLTVLLVALLLRTLDAT